MSARHYSKQRERDLALLIAYHKALRADDYKDIPDRDIAEAATEPDASEKAIIQRVLDDNGTNAYVVSRVVNELEPALRLLRDGRYNLGPIPLRSIAARIDTSLKLLEGDNG